MRLYKTYAAKAEDIERKWYLIDAKNAIVGRLAVEIANLLRGKNKPIFTRHCDTGDYVVVINAEKVVFKGTKEQNKLYVRHTGYPGGKRVETPEFLRQRHPTKILEHAIKGMVPRNRLGRAMLRKLFIYAGEEHKHENKDLETFEIPVKARQ